MVVVLRLFTSASSITATSHCKVPYLRDKRRGKAACVASNCATSLANTRPASVPLCQSPSRAPSRAPWGVGKEVGARHGVR